MPHAPTRHAEPLAGPRARLLIKYLMFPGTNWVSRDKSQRRADVPQRDAPIGPIRTLDCGCGNAYFAHQAVLRGARCLGITIHDWEKHNCEEMRDFLGLAEDAARVPRRRAWSSSPTIPGNRAGSTRCCCST